MGFLSNHGLYLAQLFHFIALLNLQAQKTKNAIKGSSLFVAHRIWASGHAGCVLLLCDIEIGVVVRITKPVLY